MSTNYYLHTPAYVNELHLGKSAGPKWTTDTSARVWSSTPGLCAWLDELASRKERGWVAGEYGKILTFGEAASLIRSHDKFTELGLEFT